MSDSCLGFACLPTKGRLFLKYMIFESYLTAQRCAVCDRHRVLYSLHLPQPCANTQSHHLLEKSKSLTVSWETARGKVPGAPWSCCTHPSEPKGPLSAPRAYPGGTPLLPHESTSKRQPCFYKELVSAIFNTCSN